MEKRLLLAVVLSIIVLVLWQLLFVKQPQETPPGEAPAEIVKKTEKESYKRAIQPPAQKEPEKKEVLRAEKFKPISAEREQTITVETSLYRAVWTNRGGVLQSWKLKKHKDENKEDLELVSSRAEELKIFPFSIKTDDPSFDKTINSVYYNALPLKLSLDNGQKGEIHFEYSDGKGNSVEKAFAFKDGSYDFTTEIKVRKEGKEINPRLLWGPGFSRPLLLQKKGRFGGSKGLAALIASRVFHMDERKYRPEQSIIDYAQWAAYEDTYFTALFLLPPVKNNTEFIREERENRADFFLLVTSPQKAYLGPKDLDILVNFGYETKKIIRFGLFGFIAEILLRAIKIIHQGIPNWGVAIIILTLLTKIIFFPLTYSSTKSMAKMQEIQPKIKALRAKYKKAKQDIAQRRRMNEEMMKLYKEHGINPAGGCLPMLIQLPVFFGFFQLLRIAIEFRHSPFILWITDLSAKDPYYVTPILMGITQYISQKITPTSGDPTQQRMMLIMPVILTFFFMSFPSGLVLYWLTQNVLQIGQQLIMNRLMKKKKVSHGKRKKRR